MGGHFLPPAGACSGADPTELLAVTKPLERCGPRSWAAQLCHSAQGSQVLQDQPPVTGVWPQAQCYVWFQAQWGSLTMDPGLGIRPHTKWERPKPALWEASQTKDMGCCQKPWEHHFHALSTSAGLANPQWAPLGKVQLPLHRWHRKHCSVTSTKHLDKSGATWDHNRHFLFPWKVEKAKDKLQFQYFQYFSFITNPQSPQPVIVTETGV